MRQMFCFLSLLYLAIFVNASFISETGSSKEVWYEPNPPVTVRVLFGIGYTDPSTEKEKDMEITIELYGSVAPKTVKNFVELAKGVKGKMKMDASEDDVLNIQYKDTIFHRIIPGFVIQGGDVLPNVAPFSIYGMKFDDETFFLKHDRPGRVSMANQGPNSNACQFFITVSDEAIPHLDEHHVVFGQVVSGLEELMSSVQNVETDDNDKPINDVKITFAFVEELKIGDLEAQHSKYLSKLEKFRNGDTSVGITMKQEQASGKKEEIHLDNELYFQNHPLARYLLAMIFFGGLAMIYKNRRYLIPSARNIVSMHS